jgi:T5SS/PEP-CTERM-associated repeat protein/autotransporter-associated beta strand protein
MRCSPGRIASVVALAACAFPSVAAAAFTQWTGEFGDDWFMDENWDTGVKPTVNDDTLVLTGPAPKIEGIATTRNVTFNNVIISLAVVSGVPSILDSRGSASIAPGATVNVEGGTWYAGSAYSTPFTVNNLLNVTNGGKVYSYHNNLGTAAGLGGRVTVSGEGSLWDATAVESGAVPKYINVGNVGVGTLDILQGGKVISENARIANGNEAVGEVRVIGAGSRWELTRFSGSSGVNGVLHVGASGDGSLKVESGGYVGALSAGVATQFGSTGDVRVRGTGSLLTVGTGPATNAALSVGSLGKGSLTVDNGGAVWSYSALVGGAILQGDYPVDAKTGTVLVTGAGSTWTTANDLIVGRNGTADFRVTFGGTATSGRTTIGGIDAFNVANTNNPGVGNVTVQFPGSKFTTDVLFIGTDATGTLEVTDSASAETDDIYIGGTSRNNNFNPRANGHLLVTRGGSLDAGTIRVGNAGTSRLTFSDGAAVDSGSGVFSYQLTSGVAKAVGLVTGPGTTWNNTRISVGAAGAGELTISDGAVVTQVGGSPSDVSAGGTVLVTGPGTAWTARGLNWIQGRVTVENGATLNSVHTFAVDVLSGHGVMTVTGPGSTWTSTTLDVGGTSAPAAELVVGPGAAVAFQNRLRLGPAAGTHAKVTQTGGTVSVGTVDSTTSTRGGLLFGPGTASSYSLAGGTLNARNVGPIHGVAADPAAGYSFTLAGGAVRAAGPLTASANATLAIGTTSTLDTNGFAFEWAGALTGPGHLAKVGLGTLTLSGANTLTGATTVHDGILRVTPAARDPLLAGPGGADLRAGRIVFTYPTGPSPRDTILPLLAAAAPSNFATGQLRSSAATPTLGLTWSDDPVARQFTLLLAPKGDLNLDGVITPDDYAVLDRAFAHQSLPTPADLNYDGTLTSADYLLIDAAYLGQAPGFDLALLSLRESQFGPAYVSGLLAAVPEPSVAFAGGFALPLLRRRRR